jgi:hypothetical protein
MRHCMKFMVAVSSVHRRGLALIPLLIDRVILSLKHLLNTLPGLLNMLQSPLLLRLQHLDAIMQLLHIILNAHTVVTCLFFRQHARPGIITLVVCVRG